MILDTNGLSAFADGEESLELVLQSASEIAIPVIVLGEYLYGIRQSRERLRYEGWLRSWLSETRILSVDEETAQRYAEIRVEQKRKGRPLPANDVWIAALARQHSLPLLTRDRHFDFVSG